MKPFTHKLLAVFLAVFTLSVQSGFSMRIMDCLHGLNAPVEVMNCCHDKAEPSDCSMAMELDGMDCCINEQVFVQYDFLSAGLSNCKDYLVAPCFTLVSNFVKLNVPNLISLRDGYSWHPPNIILGKSYQIAFQVFRL